MGKLKEWISEAAESAFGLAIMGFFILVGLGDLYWLWMAIQFGSFWMFVAGMVPPFFIIAGPVGAWSLIFGPPEWLVSMFG